jgi:hypothetical protein
MVKKGNGTLNWKVIGPILVGVMISLIALAWNDNKARVKELDRTKLEKELYISERDALREDISELKEGNRSMRRKQDQTHDILRRMEIGMGSR